MTRFLHELFFPLSAAQRKNFFILIFLSFASMFFVVAGVGAILPIVGLIVSDDMYDQYKWSVYLEKSIGLDSKAELLFLAVGLFFLMILMKVVIGIWVLVRQKALNANIRVSVTDRLFRHLMGMPYSFHVSENSGKLLRNLTSDINSHARSLESTIIILSEGVMTLGLVAILAAVDPVGLVILFLLVFVAAVGYLRVVQPRLSRWGKLFREESAAMVVHTQQALGGIKEIKVLNRQRFFENLFRSSVKRMLDYQRKFSIIQAVPVNVLEILIALGVVIIVGGFLVRGDAVTELAPVLALFMASAVRLGPSLSRIAGGIQGIRYDRPAMQALYQCLRENFSSGALSEQDQSNVQILYGQNFETWTTLRMENVSFSYPVRRDFSLSGINLSIANGGALGIFGESGSGKTTLMDIILGINEDYQGQIQLDGVDLRTVKQCWQEQIGYVPQSVFLIDDTLRRNIALGIKDADIDDDRLNSAIERAQLRPFVASLADGLDSIVGERGARISGGQQQRVGIARALYRNPSVLVFDEATSALDAQTESEFMDTVSRMHGSVTMIIIAHRLSTLRVCDQLICLEGGKIVSRGSFTELLEPD